MSPSALRLVEEDLKRIPFKGWAEMIQKVYEVDPMACPKCGAVFAIIDIAVRPGVQFHHGLGGKFNAGRGNSVRSEKANS